MIDDDEFAAILDTAVVRTGVERYRYLCLEHPDPETREGYRRLVREIAAGLGPPPAARPHFPPIAAQAKTLAASFWHWALGGFELATAEEQARRRAICAACPKWVAESRRCVLCGCKTDAKIMMATEHCPDNPSRW